MQTNFPVFITERLLLRQFSSSDLAYVFEGLSNPEVIKYYGVSYQSMSETIKQLEWFKNLESEGTGIWWAIQSVDGENFYGAVGLNNLSKVHKKAEIGFWLLPAYWGKGLIQEAIAEVLPYAFGKLNLHRIEAIVESQNKNCKKLLEKLKFKLEGMMRDCEVKNGEFISLDMYAKFH